MSSYSPGASSAPVSTNLSSSLSLLDTSLDTSLDASPGRYVWMAGIVLSLASGTSFAQSSPADQTLPAISVVEPATKGRAAAALATGIAASPLDTPFSVTSVPSALVREQAGTTLQDALRNVPGAQADTGFNGSHTQSYILRGAISDSGTGSSRVMRDGVRLSNYPYTPAFVESVDVLRGPGAAIAVRSEPGGTVNIVTKQPQLYNFGSVYLGGGNANARELSVDLNRVLSKEDEWAARLIATQSNASEWRHVPDQLTGLKLGVAKSDGARYHLRAGFEATNQSYQPDYGIPALNGRPVAVPLDRQLGEPFGNSRTENRIADLHGDVALGGDSRLAVDYTHLEAFSTSIKSLLNGSPLANQPVGTWPRVSVWEPATRRHIDSLATSLTGTQTLGGLTHRFFAGLDYYRETLDGLTLTAPASTSPPINVFDPVYGLATAPSAGAAFARTLTTENLHSVGASVQDQIDIGDWSVVAGLRFDRQHFLYGTAGVVAVDESRVSPKLAVLRHLSDSDTLYANVSTGQAPNQVSSSSNQSLPSRRSKQAEVGWKSAWLGGQLTSDVAVYQLDQSNLISSDLSTPNLFDFTIDGSARSRGLEASLTGKLGDHLDVSATYAYTDAAYRNNAVYGGKDVPNVARHTATLWAQYAWDDAWKSGAGVYVQSRRFADEANTTVLPGYARFDLTQTYVTKLAAGQSVELQLAVRNLLDRDYYVSSHLHVNRWITPAQGRNAWLSATYRF
ncbi:MAG: TonB-dependent receptor [Rhizobacter sp.]|nr:TonB-dependent receptor [Rhizobacter sp.]